MKRLPFVLFVFILFFVTSASATVYKWVDRNGVVNFADDDSKIPRDYRHQAEELNTARPGSSVPSQAPPEKAIVGTPSPKTTKQAPPVAQTLVREGDFAIKLAEALKIGKAGNEAEAESKLASVGITPKNGWIADYPVTPDIIGELEKAVGEAADAQKLALGKNEALRALRTAAVEQELPIVAEGAEGRMNTVKAHPRQPLNTRRPPKSIIITMPKALLSLPIIPRLGIITTCTPGSPPHSGAPGFISRGSLFSMISIEAFIEMGMPMSSPITGETPEPEGSSRLILREDTPKKFWRQGCTSVRGFNSTEARSGARSIFERSHGRSGSSHTSMPMTGRGSNPTNSAYSSVGRGDGGRQVYNKESRPSGFTGRYGNDRRPLATDRGISRILRWIWLSRDEQKFRLSGRYEQTERDEYSKTLCRPNPVLQFSFTGKPTVFQPFSSGRSRTFRFIFYGGRRV